MDDIGWIRTLLDMWRELNGWTYGQLGKQLGVSRQSAWRYCTAPWHADHRTPAGEAPARLRELSGGAVHVGNYADCYQRVDRRPPGEPPAAEAFLPERKAA